MKMLNTISFVLLIVGGLNWGLWGVFEFDFIAKLLGGSNGAIARVCYTFVGFAAVYQILFLAGVDKCCQMKPRHT